MSTDPYHLLKTEIETSLQTAGTLRASYVRIRNISMSTDVNGRGKGRMVDGEELVWAGNELKATLAALDADLEDLEASVRIVESTDARFFGIDEKEVAERRRYVSKVRNGILSMRAELSVSTTIQTVSASDRRGSAGWERSEPEDDDQSAWAREEQQMIIRQQDDALDSIAGTLTTLANQAGLIGHEISEHNELLDDLEGGVDRTESKLGRAMTRMKKVIRETEETKSGWCIVVLTVVLLALLLAVLLV